MSTDPKDSPLPPLADLLRWITEMPPDFRPSAEDLAAGRPRVRAVVADLFETLYGSAPDRKFLDLFDLPHVNRLQLVLAAVWVLWHPAFRAPAPPRAAIERFLSQGLGSVAQVVNAEKIGREEERSEELIRRAARNAGRLLGHETKNEAEDRFKQVDSIERQKVLAEAAERERRARAVREAMAKKAAEEAAAKVSRE